MSEFKPWMSLLSSASSNLAEISSTIASSALQVTQCRQWRHV
eukprot:CAMPEP_0119510012 /NCGR_PEP_ID=MMETSP1344-20130328/29118_1 /TAXON_ID=236787 /ORGANISM="Florenciella parvula, Strain CCMP2471" /LENGTH=41 /DNA_ID= /DNA_START= /DNA_END= /DNA_ORIENTATION=